MNIQPEALNAEYWQRQLDSLMLTHDVPGAVFAILRSDSAPTGSGSEERVVVAAGVTNVNTAQPVVPETLFQIGSVTKTWTGTLVLQLVAEGKLELDAPIKNVLPDFQVSDPVATHTVTMRQLLTHTSGIDGDIFTDTGRGDDCVEKFVAALSTAQQIFAPGTSWSYCNSGLVVAGRVVEVLRGMSWDQALAKYICEPLGLKNTTTLPEQTALHSFAVGHINVDGKPAVTPTFLIPRSSGPAGLITSSANDVLSYARSYLPGGHPVLTAESLALMLTPQVSLEKSQATGDSMGISWVLQKWGDVETVYHTGGTLGQNSHLRLFPEQGIVLFMATNGADGGPVARALFSEAAQTFAGAIMPAPFTPEPADRVAVPLEEFEGSYEAASMRVVVRRSPEDSEAWQALVSDTSGLFEASEPDVYALAGADLANLGASEADSEVWMPISFENSTGTRIMHVGSRAYPQAVS